MKPEIQFFKLHLRINILKFYISNPSCQLFNKSLVNLKGE